MRDDDFQVAECPCVVVERARRHLLGCASSLLAAFIYSRGPLSKPVRRLLSYCSIDPPLRRVEPFARFGTS